MERENIINEYYLSEKETTPYIILEEKDNYSLLKRFTKDSNNDPTPYIVANGIHKTDDKYIDWDFGNYFQTILDASTKFTQCTSEEILNEINEEDKIMDIKVNVTPYEKEDSKVKAYANVVLEDCFQSMVA